MVKAKFKVESVTKFEQNGEVVLGAVINGSDENRQFWKYTPSGKIQMHIDNDAALKQFEPGMEFYVTFERAT